jgi:hypothetical protein
MKRGEKTGIEKEKEKEKEEKKFPGRKRMLSLLGRFTDGKRTEMLEVSKKEQEKEKETRKEGKRVQKNARYVYQLVSENLSCIKENCIFSGIVSVQNSRYHPSTDRKSRSIMGSFKKKTPMNPKEEKRRTPD